MAQKVVVTTDLSVPSKAGIRFALEYASRTKSKLIFYYCLDILKPTRWSDQKFEAYKDSEERYYYDKLSAFVSPIVDKAGIEDLKYECVVESGMEVAGSVIDFALRIKARAICLSTRGAGPLKRIIGTNASKILTYSPLPVFIIPRTYRARDINSIFYASDLANLTAELPQVKSIADALQAKLHVHHYSYHVNVNGSTEEFESVVKKYKGRGIQFHFRPIVLEKKLAEQLAMDVKKSRASLAVVFTNQHKSWFEKMFLSSQSAELAFESKMPLLVIPKIVKKNKGI